MSPTGFFYIKKRYYSVLVYIRKLGSSYKFVLKGTSAYAANHDEGRLESLEIREKNNWAYTNAW